MTNKVRGQKVSINQLVKLTGQAFNTVKKRMAAHDVQSVGRDKRSIFYDSADALPACYAPETKEALIYAVERARLTKEQADKEEMENARRRGELLPRSGVVSALAIGATACRTRLLAIPTKLAPAIIPGMTMAEIAGIAEQMIHEALIELTSVTFGEGGVRRPDGDAPAPKINGKSVGRPRKKVKPRVKRRAGKVADKPG